MAVIWQFRLRRQNMRRVWLMLEHRRRPRLGHARHPNSDSSDLDEDAPMPSEVDFGPW